MKLISYLFHLISRCLFGFLCSGEPESKVFGSLIDGVFEGKIVSPRGSFYVEKARHYFPHSDNKTFHSVIYHEGHVEDPYEHMREGHSAGCGITDEISQWMANIQNAAVEDDVDSAAKEKEQRLIEQSKNKAKEQPKPEQPFSKYSREANEAHSRVKRGTRRDENRNTCSLYIQTDPLIWKHIKEGFPEVSKRTFL